MDYTTIIVLEHTAADAHIADKQIEAVLEAIRHNQMLDPVYVKTCVSVTEPAEVG